MMVIDIQTARAARDQIAGMPGSNRAYTKAEQERPFAAGRWANAAVAIAILAAACVCFGVLVSGY